MEFTSESYLFKAGLDQSDISDPQLGKLSPAMVTNGIIYEIRSSSNSAADAANVIVRLAGGPFTECNFDSLRKKIELVSTRIKDKRRRGDKQLSQYCSQEFDIPQVKNLVPGQQACPKDKLIRINVAENKQLKHKLEIKEK